MARRSFGFGLLVSGVIGVVTACGGTVVERKSGSPSEQLEQDGPDRCKTACKTIEACGLDSSDCACASSCTCVGSGDCTCPPPAPCMCEMMSGAATCERECTQTVQELLDEKSDCDAPMLAILDCLASATCKNGERPCQAESRALKECGQKDRSPDPPRR